MYLLEAISGVCSDPGLANILTIIKRFMNILWIFGPILAIIASIINGVKLMSNPDEKKYKGLFKNSIMALLFLFLVPVLINVVMGLFDKTFEFAACWNSAERVNSTTGKGSGYINKHDKKPSGSILPNPDDYKTGNKKSENTTGTGSNSNTNQNNANSSTGTSTTTRKVIFVGDSRTVGMSQSVGTNNDVWSCKGSMGLNWMKSTGIPNVDKQITSGSAVVVLMGVNDLYQVNKYIEYMNSLATGVTSRGATLYFVSVNPTSKSKDYMNEDIDKFNAKMRQGLSSQIRYIDCNAYLKANGFSSGDGVHYSVNTYKDIYNYIKRNL